MSMHNHNVIWTTAGFEVKILPKRQMSITALSMERETSTGGLYSPWSICQLRMWWLSRRRSTSTAWQRLNITSLLSWPCKSGTMTSLLQMTLLVSNGSMWWNSLLLTVATSHHFNTTLWLICGWCVFFHLLGTVDFDLSSMPLPVKRSRNCSLSQLESKAKTDNLFERKCMEGWWPVYVINKKGKETLKVGLPRIF